MIYLDNAATSYPKPKCVISEVKKCLRSYCGNPGRSSHKLSVMAAEKIYECRESISELLRVGQPERVSFTQNATHALNIAIKGIIPKDCHVIISDFEHNSVLRPLEKHIKNSGGRVSEYDSSIPLSEAILPLITPETKYIVSSICSNVTGKSIDYRALSQIAKKYKLGLILDASQYIGHRALDLSDIEFSAICAPGHKALFGLQGSGILVLGQGVSFDTLMEGGSGSDTLNTDMPHLPPERYEAGTPSTPAIAGLAAGIGYINKVGITAIEEKISLLTTQLYDRLLDVKGAEIYGCDNGIASFNLSGYDSSRVSSLLDAEGICVRSGLHCSPSVHRRLGTLDRGAVRISVSIFNKKSDLDKLYFALKAM